MFTGIIEETGTIKTIQLGKASARLKISCSKVLEQTAVGDSIAVNGVCLTVVSINDANGFCADVMQETLKRTNLGQLKSGAAVNLERALSLQDRLGGHFVSGHIDCTGKILSREVSDIAIVVRISAGGCLLPFLTAKGSVAVDGISLTVVAVDSDSFTVSMIPHTAGQTTLGSKKSGDSVNLEADVLAKYTARLLQCGWLGQQPAACGAGRVGSDKKGLGRTDSCNSGSRKDSFDQYSPEPIGLGNNQQADRVSNKKLDYDFLAKNGFI